MTIFFTADQHFGHKNVIGYSKRPFSNVLEMDATLIKLWNETVSDDDVVYHLGDFTLLGFEFFEQIISQLNGDIRIVPGGHDWRWMQGFGSADRVVKSRSGIAIDILDPLYSLEIAIQGERHPLVIVLCHYPMRRWDRSHYGAYHLYGHEHGEMPGLGRSMDAGVDCWGYRPISLDTVVQYLVNLPILDHHEKGN